MKGLHKEKEKKTRAKWNSKKTVSLDASCSVLMGNSCDLSASIQQLVPNPLGRNASPIPLSACLHHTAGRCLPAHCSNTLSALQPWTGMHALQQGLHQG